MCTLIKELFRVSVDRDLGDVEPNSYILFFKSSLQGVRDHIDDVRDRENEIGGILSIFCDVIIPYSDALPCNKH